MTDKVPPRKVPDCDSKYMGIAWMIAGFSKDPSTQVGSLIVSPENKPKGWGYNGPPKEIDDCCFSWERPEKYDFVIHAEENAIAHSDSSEGCTLYVTTLPCKRCMLRIVKHGIRRVVYYNFWSHSQSMQQAQEDIERSLDIARKGKIRVEKFVGDISWIADWVMHLRNLNIFNRDHTQEITEGLSEKSLSNGVRDHSRDGDHTHVGHDPGDIHTGDPARR